MKHSALTKSLAILVVVSGVATGCAGQGQVDAYTCEGVSSTDGANTVTVVPITIPGPSHFAKSPEAYEKLKHRRSVRAEYGGLDIEIQDLCRDSHVMKIELQVVNRGDNAYQIPTDALAFVVNEAFSPDDGEKVEVPAKSPVNTIWVFRSIQGQPYEFTKTEDGTIVVSQFFGDAIDIRPNEEADIHLTFRGIRSKSGSLQLPLTNVVSKNRTTLEFELAYFMTYKRARY